MKQKKQSGGSRIGAGRPPKEPTIIVTFRILPEWKERIKKVVLMEIEGIKKEQTN